MFTMGFVQKKKGKISSKSLNCFSTLSNSGMVVDRDMYAAYWQGTKMSKGSWIRHFQFK